MFPKMASHFIGICCMLAIILLRLGAQLYQCIICYVDGYNMVTFEDGDLIGIEGEYDEGSCQGEACCCFEQGSVIWTHPRQI